MTSSDGGPGDPSADLASALRPEIERGLRFAHVMLHVNQTQGNEALAHVHALLEILIRKGIVDEEEMKDVLERTRQEVDRVVRPRIRMAQLGDKHAEGESADVPCAELIPICRARCCTFRFYLTKQDLDEGVVCWDYGNPYWIRQGPDGYCAHFDRASRGCGVYLRRPHVCRKYDCREDKRVWLDFARRIPAPLPDRLTGDAVALSEVSLQGSLGDGVVPTPEA